MSDGVASPFPSPGSKNALEKGGVFSPKFDSDGLISAIVTDASTGGVLMLAMMNAEALTRTLETGEAHFYSRSRKELWHKGAISGNVLKVIEIRTDCDQDAVWIAAEAKGHGAACHTGRKSCFYRRVIGGDGGFALEDDESKTLFDAEEIYRRHI